MVRRAAALSNLQGVLDGARHILLSLLHGVREAEMKKLLKIRGIGNWTAQYIAMRTMAWTDAFLETDAGIKKALPGLSPKELLKLAEPWRPWRSYANMCLWNSLYGEEKTECM